MEPVALPQQAGGAAWVSGRSPGTEALLRGAAGRGSLS